MTPVTNHKDLRDEENNHGHGHEIILHSMPNAKENEMAANHPEEDDEEELDEEDEMHSSNTNHGCRFSRSRALTAFLAAAGVVAVVGGGSIVFLAAGGKPSTTITSNMQVANVLAPAGYQVVGAAGDGICQDESSEDYPFVQYAGIGTADGCATKCNECVAGDFPTFVGMYYIPSQAVCGCLVSQTGSLDFSQLSGTCYPDGGSSANDLGTGPVARTGPFPFEGVVCTCYCREGQCPVDGTDVPSIAPSESPSDAPSIALSESPSDAPSIALSESPSDAPSIALSESPGTAKASKRPKGPKAPKMPKASSSLQVQQMKSGGDPSFSSLSVVGVCGTFAVVIITFMFIDLI